MDISEITKILKIDGLDEQAQKDFEVALQNLVQERSKEVASTIIDPVIEQAKKELQESFDAKLVEEKEKLVTNWSNFVDNIMDEVMVIPAYVMEYAKQGQLYGPVIEQIKVRIAIDENVLDAKTKEALSESLDTIEKYEEKINILTKENIDLTAEAAGMASALYIQEKCAGLPEEHRKKIIDLITPTNNVTKIDEQFEHITSILIKEETKKEDEDLLKEETGVGHKEVESIDKTDSTNESWIDKYQREIVQSYLKG